MRVRAEHFGRQLLQRGNVIQDPEPASVGCNRQIVEILLRRDPVHRRVRQIVLQRLPAPTVVKRHIQRVFRTEIKQPLANGSSRHAVGITQHARRNSVRDLRPRFAEIVGLVNERIAVVHLVKIHRDVSHACVPARSFDVAHGAPLGQAADIGRDVCPILAASRVICTSPSFVPAQITPACLGDIRDRKTTPAYSTPMLSGVRPPEIPILLLSFA